MAWTAEEEERGRKLHDGGRGLTSQETYLVLMSDKITRLEVEIERLRAERDHWLGLVSRADVMQFPFEHQPSN